MIIPVPIPVWLIIAVYDVASDVDDDVTTAVPIPVLVTIAVPAQMPNACGIGTVPASVIPAYDNGLASAGENRTLDTVGVKMFCSATSEAGIAPAA